MREVGVVVGGGRQRESAREIERERSTIVGVCDGRCEYRCRTKLAPFKVPKNYVFQELPKTSTGLSPLSLSLSLWCLSSASVCVCVFEHTHACSKPTTATHRNTQPCTLALLFLFQLLKRADTHACRRGRTSDTSRCGVSASRCWSLCLSFSDSTLDTFVRLFVCFRQTSEVQVAGRTQEARLITSHAHTHTLRMHTHTPATHQNCYVRVFV
jgi:hypothetical protein